MTARDLTAGPVAIEVRDVAKAFDVPTEKVDSLKERVVRLGRPAATRRLQAVDALSFDVHRGEFFGIVGRNGSGKSTLLKILASIYRADAGTVRMAGRLAPFIELGVGFNPELTSRENVVLNGVLMGLTRREAARRLDAVLDFAELREFADLKLKNYSSGMMVRLAFSSMVEADADIMLVDEVLAVGDAAFAAKCMDVFAEKRRSGRTIVLVTHDMATVQAMCDRAMLVHDGELRYLGDPEETALRYYRLNFQGEGDEAVPGGVPDVNVRLVDAWLATPDGTRVDAVEQGVPIHFHAHFDARHDLEVPGFAFQFYAATDRHLVFGVNRTLEETVGAGRRIALDVTIANPLLPGRYQVDCWVSRNRRQGDVALHPMRVFDFQVYGTRPGPGDISVDADVAVTVSS